jgi:hypothetical protein
MQQVSAVDPPSITVAPNHFELNLTAGSRINKSITLTWTGERPVLVFFRTSITPDEKGMNLWFNEDPVTMLASSTKKVNMSIKALVNIVPGQYKIEVYAISDTNELSNLFNTTDQLNAQIDYLEGQIRNLTGHADSNITAMLTTIDSMQDAIDTLNGKITDLENKEPVAVPDNSWMMYLISILLIIDVILIILLLRKRKNVDGGNQQGYPNRYMPDEDENVRVRVKRGRAY